MPKNNIETIVSFLHKILHLPSHSITQPIDKFFKKFFLSAKEEKPNHLPLFLRHTVDQCSELRGPTQNSDRSWPPVRLTDKQLFGRRVLGT